MRAFFPRHTCPAPDPTVERFEPKWNMGASLKSAPFRTHAIDKSLAHETLRCRSYEPMTTETAPTCSTAPAGTPIDLDVPCAGCGYNLRTLPRDGVCPECGKSIAQSWYAYSIRRADLGQLRESGLPWLRAMREGVTIALVAFVLSLFGIGYRVEGILPRFDSVRTPLWLVPFVVVYVLSCYSSWKLMTPRLRRRSLFVARAVLLIALCSIALMFLDERILPRASRLYAAARTAEGFFEQIQRIAAIATLTWPVLIAATFGRLVQVAWLARRRAIGALFAVAGIAWSALAALITYSITQGTGPYQLDYSSQFAPLLIGPTGTMPAFWTGVALVTREFGRANFENSGWRDVVAISIAVLVIAALASVGLLLFVLRRTLTRAILLSEESEASSPTSPSPHLPQ
jgi:hypothetical protein